MKSLLLFYIFLLCIFKICLARKSCNCIVNENTLKCCNNINGRILENGNCLINIYVTPFFDCCKEYSENNESGKCKNVH